MNDLSIGTDDYRVLEYARLVDPEVWPELGDPEVNASTAPRLMFSIEAGYRIAVHEGGVADPTDVVARLSTALGLPDVQNGLRRPLGIGEAELASMAAVLMGGQEDGGPGTETDPGRQEETVSVPADELVSREERTRIIDEIRQGSRPIVVDEGGDQIEIDPDDWEVDPVSPAERTRIIDEIRQGSRPIVVDGGGDQIDPDDQEVDPDHDPEAGISHVGDDDEGQHHEEP